MVNSIDLFDAHEKKRAWTEVWYLTQRDSEEQPLYYKGLTENERASLLDYFYDLLEVERREEVGDRLSEPDETPDERPKSPTPEDTAPPAGPLPIHDPSLYLYGEGSSWIPWAADAISGAKRGTYRKGYPEGLVVHWTAGWRNGLKAGNELMRNTGMLYLLVDGEGRLAQSDSLKHHGYHAGKSSHSGATGYVSDEYAGVELQAAGMLERRGSKYYSWFDATYPATEVVTSQRDQNIAPGHYHAYTRAQMMTLRKLIVWLYLNRPDVFSIDRVVGHDEVSPGRKVDPGASLLLKPETKDQEILNMEEFRNVLWNDVDIVTELRKTAA